MQESDHNAKYVHTYVDFESEMLTLFQKRQSRFLDI